MLLLSAVEKIETHDGIKVVSSVKVVKSSYSALCLRPSVGHLDVVM